MRVIVLVEATKDSEAGALPTSDLLEAMGTWSVDNACRARIAAGA